MSLQLLLQPASSGGFFSKPFDTFRCISPSQFTGHFTQGTLNNLLPNLLYIANHSAQERSETLQYVFNFYICKHPKWLNWWGKKTKGTLLLFFCFCLKPSSYSKADQYINRDLNNPVYDLHPGFTHTVIFIPSYKGTVWVCTDCVWLTYVWLHTEHSDSFHLVTTITVLTVQVLAEAVAVPHGYIHKASGTSPSDLPQSILPEEHNFIQLYMPLNFTSH